MKDRGCLANNLDFAIIKIESIGLKIFNLKIWGRKMENYILLLLTSAIDAYIWLLVSKIFLREKYHFKVYLGGWLLFAFFLFLKSIAAKNMENETFKLLLWVAGGMVMAFLTVQLFEGTILHKILSIAVYLIGTGISDLLIILGLMALFPGISIGDFTNVTYHGVVYSFIGKVTVLFLLFLIKNKLHPNLELTRQYGSILISMVAFDVIMIALLYVTFMSKKIEFTEKMGISFCVLNLVLITGFSACVLRQMKISSKLLLEDRLKMQNTEMRLEQNADMGMIVKSVRSLRHDMNNHLNVIQGLVNAKRYERLKEYVAELSGSMEYINEYIITENDVLSMVLNNKNAIAHEKKVDFTANVWDSKIGLGDMEICSLFGNILDNAVRAAEECEEGYVELTIQKVEQGHKITCINNYKTDPVQKNGRLVTTKGDAESHGIGICSVSDIVRNAGGILNYGTENEEFHVEIYLPKREGGSM